MNIQDYLRKVNKKSQSIFEASIVFADKFGAAHHLAVCLEEIYKQIQDINDRFILSKVNEQLEFSCLNLAYGMYRQAYASLRLGLEMGLGAAYFSVNKMEQAEWMRGGADIVWAKLIDSEAGVLSSRYAMAFFPELKDYMCDYNSRARRVYRNLSEYVHGNNGTWKEDGSLLEFEKDLFDRYFERHLDVCNVLIFVLLCRYMKSFSSEQIDSIQNLQEEIRIIVPIREMIGGPKE